jgi:hypothetical protein
MWALAKDRGGTASYHGERDIPFKREYINLQELLSRQLS